MAESILQFHYKQGGVELKLDFGESIPLITAQVSQKLFNRLNLKREQALLLTKYAYNCKSHQRYYFFNLEQKAAYSKALTQK